MRDVLQRADALARLELEHAVDQQDRVAVRQALQDLVDVHLHVLLAFQCAHAAAQRMQLPQRGGVLVPDPILVEGEHAAVAARLGDRARHRAGRADVHVVADLHMADHAGLAGEGAVRADARAAGDAHAGRHRGVRADTHVVRDLHQVVELDAVLEHRVLAARRGRRSCWRRSRRRRRCRTAPSCSIFSQRPSIGAKPKPSAPMTTPPCRMQRAPMRQRSPTTTCAARRVCSPITACAPTWHCGPIDRAAADDRALADMRQRADAGLLVDDGAGLDHGARVHARRPPACACAAPTTA